jgi:hypothetical protein
VLSDLQIQNLKSKELFEEHLFVVSKGNVSLKGKINPSELDEKKQIYINWGESYRIWHNKNFKDNINYKFEVDSARLAYKLLDDTSYFFAPFSVCMAMREFYDYQISSLPDAPTRKIYMISSPFESTLNQKPITFFKKKIMNYIHQYSDLQQTLLKKLESSDS